VVLQDEVDHLEVLQEETQEVLQEETQEVLHPVEDHHHLLEVEVTIHPLLCVALVECLLLDNRVLRLQDHDLVLILPVVEVCLQEVLLHLVETTLLLEEEEGHNTLGNCHHCQELENTEGDQEELLHHLRE